MWSGWGNLHELSPPSSPPPPPCLPSLRPRDYHVLVGRQIKGTTILLEAKLRANQSAWPTTASSSSTAANAGEAAVGSLAAAATASTQADQSAKTSGTRVRANLAETREYLAILLSHYHAMDGPSCSRFVSFVVMYVSVVFHCGVAGHLQ